MQHMLQPWLPLLLSLPPRPSSLRVRAWRLVDIDMAGHEALAQGLTLFDGLYSTMGER
jgi:hypothetical protein